VKLTSPPICSDKPSVVGFTNGIIALLAFLVVSLALIKTGTLKFPVIALAINVFPLQIEIPFGKFDSDEDQLNISSGEYGSPPFKDTFN